MSEFLKIDRHNYLNPECPYCHHVTSKNGIISRVHGKVQRFRCYSCGRTFQTIMEVNQE